MYQLLIQHFLQQNALGILLRSLISEDHGIPLSEAQVNANMGLYWLAQKNGVS